jgi:hypothetical protein
MQIDADIPPYLRVPDITNPRLQEVPPLESFQGLDAGERVVKSYQIRVRKPKLPLLGLLFLALVVTLPAAALWQEFTYDQARSRAYDRAEKRKLERMKRVEREGQNRPYYDYYYESPYDAQYDEERPDAGTFAWHAVLIFVVMLAGGISLNLVFAMRGHTFLYLTNQRLVVLELEQGVFGRRQAVCSFSVGDVAGFQLMAQRGLSKFLGLLTLSEKRTFYLSITTKTSNSFAIGAVTTRRSNYSPGRDAVALCGELDAQVLALKTAPSK